MHNNFSSNKRERPIKKIYSFYLSNFLKLFHKNFKAYNIRVVTSDLDFNIERRYSEFSNLYSRVFKFFVILINEG